MGEFLEATSKLGLMEKPSEGVRVASFTSVNVTRCGHAKKRFELASLLPRRP